MENVRQIIAADYKKNHRNREYSLEQAQSAYETLMERGEHQFAMKNVVFLYHAKDARAIEFHSINGGSAQDLIDGITEFLKMLSKNFDVAVTYYDNPKVNLIADKSPFAHAIKKIDQGTDKTYELLFDLRSA